MPSTALSVRRPALAGKLGKAKRHNCCYVARQVQTTAVGYMDEALSHFALTSSA